MEYKICNRVAQSHFFAAFREAVIFKVKLSTVYWFCIFVLEKVALQILPIVTTLVSRCVSL